MYVCMYACMHECVYDEQGFDRITSRVALSHTKYNEAAAIELIFSNNAPLEREVIREKAKEKANKKLRRTQVCVCYVYVLYMSVCTCM